MVGEEFISVRVHDAVQYCQELMMERGRNALVLPDLEKGKVPLSKTSPPASFSDAADDVQGANLAQTESEIKRWVLVRSCWVVLLQQEQRPAPPGCLPIDGCLPRLAAKRRCSSYAWSEASA